VPSQFALGRAPVGEGGWEPSYPAAFLLPTLGTVPGAQQSMEIANMMQDEVIRLMLNAGDYERGGGNEEEERPTSTTRLRLGCSATPGSHRARGDTST
jgi:hypothetical protein